MKGQNNLDKKKVRKEAIKMTAYTMIAAIGIEIVTYLVSSSFLAIDPIQVLIVWTILDIPLGIGAYFDFKREIIQILEDGADDKISK